MWATIVEPNEESKESWDYIRILNKFVPVVISKIATLLLLLLRIWLKKKNNKDCNKHYLTLSLHNNNKKQ